MELRRQQVQNKRSQKYYNNASIYIWFHFHFHKTHTRVIKYALQMHMDLATTFIICTDPEVYTRAHILDVDTHSLYMYTYMYASTRPFYPSVSVAFIL